MGHLAGVRQLAVETQQAGKRLLVGTVHQVGSRRGVAAVHAQVEGTVEAGGEAALGHVELVAAHAKVGQQAVDLPHSMQPQEGFQVPEILVDEREAGIAFQRPALLLRVFVLVEGIEPALRPEGGKNGTRVTAATEGDIDIGAILADGQPLDGFL